MVAELPLILQEDVLVPGDLEPLWLVDETHLLALDEALHGDGRLVVSLVKGGRAAWGDGEPHRVATVARVVEVRGEPDLREVWIRGEERVEITEVHDDGLLPTVTVTKAPDEEPGPRAGELAEMAVDTWLEYVLVLAAVQPERGASALSVWTAVEGVDPVDTSYRLAIALPLPPATIQRFLEAESVEVRLLEETAEMEADLRGLETLWNLTGAQDAEGRTGADAPIPGG